MDAELYRLVESSVAFAGEQLADNLRFNSEVLTDVLYDNIRKLVSQGFESDSFAQWLADELVSRGCVVRESNEGSSTPSSGKPGSVPVQDMDDIEHQELLDRIHAAIILIQTNGPSILKSLDGLGREDAHGVSTPSSNGDMSSHIQALIDRLKTNNGSVEAFMGARAQLRHGIGSSIASLGERVDGFANAHTQMHAQRTRLASRIKDVLAKAGANWRSANEHARSIQGALASRPKASAPRGTRIGVRTARLPGMERGVRRGTLRTGRAQSGNGRKSIGQRVKGRISAVVGRIKSRVSGSTIGKTYRTLVKALRLTVGVVKGVVRAVVKTAKAMWKTARFASKTFLSASRFTGNAIKGVGKAAISGIKKAVRLASKGQLVSAVVNFAPGKIVAKMGWRAMKFVGARVWRGIKKLVFKTASFFGRLLRIVGRFVNGVTQWVGILSAGIRDRIHSFIIKPLATMLVSVFSFVTSIVMSPIQFIKWLASAIFDRVFDALSNIARGVSGVLRQVWGVMKSILMNPITISVLVGGLFFVFGRWLFETLTAGVESIRERIVTPLKSIASRLLQFMRGAWNVISSVGGFVFDTIEWLTNPKGMLAKFIVGVVKAVSAFKSLLSELMACTGTSTIDTLCMFLAGDWVGVALHSMMGVMKKLWTWLKGTKAVKLMIGMVKGIVAIGKLITGFGSAIVDSITGSLKQLMLGNFDQVLDALTAPWKGVWQQIKDLFSGRAFSVDDAEFITDNPVESGSERMKEASIAVRSLKMKGKASSNMEYFKRIQGMMGQAEYGDILTRLQSMEKLAGENVDHVNAYDEFIGKTWDMGKQGADVAQQLLKAMLESPVMSQKLLSVFFMYNPQTGETEMLRPQAYISQFLDNIREMMADPDRDDNEAFRTLIEAFDQMNKERSHIVNNQVDAISDFARKLADFNQGEGIITHLQQMQARALIHKFNSGNMFSADVQGSFQQIAKGQAKTRELESVTGEKLGNNKLLEVKPLVKAPGGGVSVRPDDFKMSEKSLNPPPSRDTIGNVVLPPGSNPEPIVDASEELRNRESWWAHQKKRRDYINAGHTQAQADAAGLESMTLDEYMQRRPRTRQQLQAEESNVQKRTAAARMAKMVSTYHNQGSLARPDGFNLTGNPSIIQIPMDNLGQTLYMFSPEWRKYNAAVELNEDEILLSMDRDKVASLRRAERRRQEELRKKNEEESRRRREEQILDYSAKVDGGFIEVKIGEDVDSMRQAWLVHQRKRREFINAGHTQAQADEAGLVSYSWEDWKRYYRKMHGLPEDGIKRIPFEGKRKERQIDWSARYPLSVDELAKYGIEVSGEGPVMIPLDKAMQAASSLLKNAKTIYSVRDGLEVMRQGLKTETNRLKRQNREGPNMGVASIGGGDGGESTVPVPPDQSHYSDVG